MMTIMTVVDGGGKEEGEEGHADGRGSRSTLKIHKPQLSVLES
jgi:hypothetical protein